MNKRALTWAALLAAGLLLLAPMAWASSIEFGGNSTGTGVHLHSQGRVNFQWVSVTGTSGDSLAGYYWGANDIDIFDAIGLAYGSYILKSGDSFTGLDYTVSSWLDKTSRPNIDSRDQGSSYTGWNFYGSMNISTITFNNDNSITMTGSLTDMVNKLTGSAVLKDIAGSSNVDFTINIVSSSKSGDLLAALNSGQNSSWANLSGSISTGAVAMVVPPPTVPEPGTLALMGSALASGGFFWRRRARKEDCGQA